MAAACKGLMPPKHVLMWLKAVLAAGVSALPVERQKEKHLSISVHTYQLKQEGSPCTHKSVSLQKSQRKTKLFSPHSGTRK